MSKKSSLISSLSPQKVWSAFANISKIPRESKHEEHIRAFIINYAEVCGLLYKEDAVGNVVVHIPATKGLEHAPTVVVQSHLDMVCEKDPDSTHDFAKDPIELIHTDEWVHANKTTLGADNGMGVSAALALMTETSPHGPIECLFTVDEETGLTGASELQADFISGNILLNLDTEEDGVFFIGCAGGADTVIRFDKKTIPQPKDSVVKKLSVKGLLGGHSGVDIHTGKANAIKILARTLKKIEHLGITISSITGGTKRNAIPRDAHCLVFIAEDKIAAANVIITEFLSDLFIEYQTSDPNIEITIEDCDDEITTVFSPEFSSDIVNTLIALPHGLVALCQDIPELVETSSNLAKISCEKTKVVIETSQRSSVASALQYMRQNVHAIAVLAGAHVESTGGYPGWKPNPGSQIVQLAEKIYQETFRVKPEIKAVHAGLECGLLGQKFPDMDMLSFGPTILGAHSPSERVHVASVEKFYRFLLVLLEKICHEYK